MRLDDIKKLSSRARKIRELLEDMELLLRYPYRFNNKDLEDLLSRSSWIQKMLEETEEAK
jgi:predicted metal-dependent hydrolase